MDISILIRFFGIALLISLNAFFVAIGFSVVASRRTTVEELAAVSSGVKRVLGWVESQDAKERLIAASQIGITVATLALGYLGEGAFASVLEPLVEHYGIEATGLAAWLLAKLPLLVSLMVVTGLLVTFGEQVPKAVSLRAPEATAIKLSRAMAGYAWLARPFVWLLDRVTVVILRLFGMQPVDHSSLYTVDELKQIVEESEQSGVLDAEERELLYAVFGFGDLSAGQVMIPRTEMVCLPVDATIDEALDLASEAMLTKFPVYKEDLDHIAGILHTKDLVKAIRTNIDDVTVRGLVREAIFVPESIRVDDLLTQFRLRRQHIAILLDEYAGTAGLVTLEDLLEELIGDVQDVFDRPEPQIKRLSDDTALIDGLVLTEDVNEMFGLQLKDPSYNTIAGFVLGQLQRIGAVGDAIEVVDLGARLRFTIEAMDGLRIALVKLDILEKLPVDTEE